MVGGRVGGGCGEGWPGSGQRSARIAIEIGIIMAVVRVFLDRSFICLLEVLLARIGTSSGHVGRPE